MVFIGFTKIYYKIEKMLVIHWVKTFGHMCDSYSGHCSKLANGNDSVTISQRK